MSFYMLSIILFSLSAPLMLSIIMILICLIVSVNSFLIFPDPWCGLIFLMIFFGGLLVLFIYISTLATNETMSPNMLLMVFLTPMAISSMNLLNYNWSGYWQNSMPQAVYLFNSNYYMLSISLMAYLLFALFIVSQITFFHYGALRDVSVNTF